MRWSIRMCRDGDAHAVRPLRAWLAAADDLGDYCQEIVDEAGVTVAPGMASHLDVWLAQDRGRLWIAHIMVWMPCDA